MTMHNAAESESAPLLQPIKHHPETGILSLAITESKAILNISLPMALTGLLLYSRSLISLLFLGRLGDLPLAAGSLALAFANITGYSLLSGLASGMDPLCSQSHGARSPSLLSRALLSTVLLLSLTSLPIAALWLNLNRILLLCRQDPALSSHAQIFLLFSLPDLLAQSLLHPLRIYLRAQSLTLPLAIAAAFSTLLHAPLCFALSPILGLRGIALASVFSDFAFAIALLVYIRNHDLDYRISISDFASLLSLAIPSCVSVCLEWWWYEIMILLAGLLANPTATLASMGILIQTTSFIYIFPSSLSVGVSTRVGNLLGAGRPGMAKRAATVGMVMGVAVGVAALQFAMGVRHVWARLFTGDAEIIALTSVALPILGMCELGNCPQTTGCGVLRGTARPKVGANINLGCFYGVGMPVAVWLVFYGGWDFKGLWVGLLAAQVCCAAAMLWVVGRTDWEAEEVRARELTGGGGGEVGVGGGEKGGSDEYSCFACA